MFSKMRPEAPGAHIPANRLVDFMLFQTSLSVEETEHLANCDLCLDAMAKATLKEFGGINE